MATVPQVFQNSSRTTIVYEYFNNIYKNSPNLMIFFSSSLIYENYPFGAHKFYKDFNSVPDMIPNILHM